MEDHPPSDSSVLLFFRFSLLSWCIRWHPERWQVVRASRNLAASKRERQAEVDALEARVEKLVEDTRR